jgi:hypothetical protein
METGAYVCSHVFNGRRPVLLVSREGGDWQFLCGNTDHEGEIPRVVGVNHLLGQFPDLRDLPPEWDAERESEASEWKRRRSPPSAP